MRVRASVRTGLFVMVRRAATRIILMADFLFAKPLTSSNRDNPADLSPTSLSQIGATSHLGITKCAT